MSRTRAGLHSGYKAPADVRHVLAREGWATHDQAVAGWRSGRLLQGARLAGRAAIRTGGSPVVAQYPTAFVPDALLARLPGPRIAFVHDVDSLRHGRDPGPELARLALFDVVVVHTEAMAGLFQNYLSGKAPRIVVLDMFDYVQDHLPALSDHDVSPSTVFFAGNLSREKAPFVYGPDLPPLTLYGSNLDTEAPLPLGATFAGSVPQGVPVFPRSGFGLVWDGTSAHHLGGCFGDYLRYNAPHKLSFYVAGGIPVLVPREAGISDYVERTGIGLSIDSLDDLDAVVRRCSDREWARMCGSVARVREQLHRGHHTLRAVAAALEPA